MSKSIQTGVDRLVDIIHKYKKISLDKAAKELGVSNVVVQEWADFLEEEGIIGMEYSLSTVFLVEKKLSKKDVDEKSHEYDSKKESFIRKIETTVSTLERESRGFEDIRKEFETLKGDIGNEIDKVKNEILELNKYEDFKKNIDSEIRKEQEEYKKSFVEIDAQLKSQEKMYNDLISSIVQEKLKLKKEKDDLSVLQKEETELRQRLNAIIDIIESIRLKINAEKASILSSDEKIRKLDELADKIEQDLKSRKEKTIDPLIKKSEEQKAKIVKIQEDIAKKVQETKTHVEGSSVKAEQVSQKFREFFDKKANIENIFNQIEKDKTELKQDLELLKKKALVLSIAKSEDVTKQVNELSKKFEDIEEKKKNFDRDLEKLNTLVKKKD